MTRAVENIIRPLLDSNNLTESQKAELKTELSRANRPENEKAVKVREMLNDILMFQIPGSPKAIEIYSTCQAIVIKYPLNDKDPEGNFICPITNKPINFENIANDYTLSAASGYIIETKEHDEWLKKDSKTDPFSQKPYSEHERFCLGLEPTVEAPEPSQSMDIVPTPILYNVRVLPRQEERETTVRVGPGPRVTLEALLSCALVGFIVGMLGGALHNIKDNNVNILLTGAIGAVAGVSLFLLSLLALKVSNGDCNPRPLDTPLRFLPQRHNQVAALDAGAAPQRNGSYA